MNRTDYRAQISTLHSDVCAVTRKIHALMTALGDNSATREWSELYAISQALNSSGSALYDILQPKPTALEDDEPAAWPSDKILMVCADCGEPVDGHFSTLTGRFRWQHSSPSDAEVCPSGITGVIPAADVPIPFDLAAPALSIQIND